MKDNMNWEEYSKAMAETREVVTINGGYIILVGNGMAWGIAAYEHAEDRIEDWCDRKHEDLQHIDLVCGWQAADRLLVKCGLMKQEEYDSMYPED